MIVEIIEVEGFDETRLTITDYTDWSMCDGEGIEPEPRWPTSSFAPGMLIIGSWFRQIKFQPL